MSFNIKEIFSALDAYRVEYVVVGGFAVILHGYMRATADLDLVIGLSDENCKHAVEAFSSIGLQPRLPVLLSDFANPANRDEWANHRGMIVFQLWDPKNPVRSIDLFVQEPMDFSLLQRDAVTRDIDGHPVKVASIEHLVVMKQKSGRARDVEDIAKLLQIRASGDGERNDEPR